MLTRHLLVAHLNRRGYELWFNAFEPKVEAIVTRLVDRELIVSPTPSAP